MSSIHLAKRRVLFTCLECRVASTPELMRYEDAMEFVASCTELKQQLEEIFAKHPETDSELPPELAALAWTPQKALKMTEAYLRNAEHDLKNILDAMPEAERLRLALAEAIKREDYEEAARLQPLLQAANKQAGKKGGH